MGLSPGQVFRGEGQLSRCPCQTDWSRRRA
jgi:hypothetical protein